MGRADGARGTGMPFRRLESAVGPIGLFMPVSVPACACGHPMPAGPPLVVVVVLRVPADRSECDGPAADEEQVHLDIGLALRRLPEAALAPSTRKLYADALRRFETWLDGRPAGGPFRRCRGAASRAGLGARRDQSAGRPGRGSGPGVRPLAAHRHGAEAGRGGHVAGRAAEGGTLEVAGDAGLLRARAGGVPGGGGEAARRRKKVEQSRCAARIGGGRARLTRVNRASCGVGNRFIASSATGFASQHTTIEECNMQSTTVTKWLLLVALTTAFSTGAATDGTFGEKQEWLNGVDATDLLRVAAGRLKFDERTTSFRVIPHHGYSMPNPCPMCPPGGDSGSACASNQCSVHYDQCSSFGCGSCLENSGGIPGIGRCTERGTGG